MPCMCLSVWDGTQEHVRGLWLAPHVMSYLMNPSTISWALCLMRRWTYLTWPSDSPRRESEPDTANSHTLAQPLNSLLQFMENGWGFGSLHVLINDPRVILYIQQAMYNPVSLQKKLYSFCKTILPD